MSNTINNSIPFVPENTIDPAAGLNLSLNTIDALLQVLVQTVGANTPPAGIEGQRHIVGTAPTGAWAGQANKLARFLDGVWRFYDARYALNAADGFWYVRSASTWSALAGGAPAWGSITGTLSAQTDLQGALDGKVGAGDSRLTDAREWSAETVLQAEAEAGTATTRRAWTALRVRQAVVAWWNSISSAFGRSLVSSADAAAGRSALGLGTFATESYAAAPFINLIPDSGRMTQRMNPLALLIPAGNTFVACDFLAPYNGAVATEAGRFYHDNSTNGGGAPALTQDMQDLLLALGRQGDIARYGVEFFIETVTAGSGTAVTNVGLDGISRALLTVNNGRVLFASNSFGTYVGWVRPKTGSAHISFDYYKNGVLVPATTPLDSGWQHVRVVVPSGYGYSSGFPYVHAVAGSQIQFGLPAFFSGLVDAGLHRSPLPTTNELSV